MGNELDAVVVQEVGLRDGLQRLSSIMPTDDKKRWINTAYSAGCIIWNWRRSVY
jgi:hydroxymethylglutaryl-CoA lyase